MSSKKNAPSRFVLPCACIVTFPALYFTTLDHLVTLCDCRHSAYYIDVHNDVRDKNYGTHAYALPISEAIQWYQLETGKECSTMLGNHRVYYKIISDVGAN